MRVLAVDTTSAFSSVALLDGGSLRAEEHLTEADKPSLHLLTAIERVLLASGTSATGVEGFAVAVGPGSFTGLRVGLSTVQGLALGAGRPCLGVSVLDVLAAASDQVAAVTFALTDAYRGEVYWARYDGARSPIGRAQAGPLADLLGQAPAGAAFVGDAAVTYGAMIAERIADARFPVFPRFLAASLGLLAEPRLRAGQGSGPEGLRPLYVRAVAAVRGSGA